MPYAPGVQFDPSPLYQGIANLGQGLAAGILERKKKEEEKQKKTAALAFARKFMPMVNPDMANVDDKTLGAGIESMGVDNVLSMADHIAKQATAKKEADQRQQLIQQQISMYQAQMDDQTRNRAALQQAASPQAGLADQILSGARFNQIDPNQAADPARSYIRAGGSDPAQMNQLNDMASRMVKVVKPMPGSAGYSKQEVPGVGTMVVDNATGEPVDTGKFTRTERKTDEKALTQTEIQQVNALQQSGRDLDALEKAFNEIGDADFGGPVSGRIKGLDPTNVNVSRIVNLVTAATPNLARGVFREVGVLTDQDVARYQKLLPNVTDTAAQRKQKFADLRARLTDTTKETLGTLKSAGRDVEALQGKLASESTSPGAFKDADGTEYPIKTVRGRRGIIKGGKFYPIVQ